MSGGDVIKILKKNGLLSTKEIANQLDISFQAVFNNLKNMDGFEVEVIKVDNVNGRKKFLWKLKEDGKRKPNKHS
jgi:predicted ArsR family transcriptional regulator